MRKRKYWSQEEENFIISHIADMSVAELAERFHIDKQRMVDKIHKMGLNSKAARGILWTKEEDTLLKEHFEYAPKQYLMDLFPGKTWPAIYQRGLKTLKMFRKTKDRATLNYNFFSSWTHESAYVVGFTLSDGHIHLVGSNTFQIHVAGHAEDVLVKIAAAMDYGGHIYHKGDGSILLQMNNVKLIEDLHQLGIPLKGKTYVAEYPNNVPPEFERDLIRGLIDGDGWSRISKCDGTYNLGLCGTYNLVNTVNNILNNGKLINHVRQQGPNCWRFNIKGKRALRIASWLYDDATIYLNQKFNAYQEALKEIARRSGNAARTGRETQ